MTHPTAIEALALIRSVANLGTQDTILAEIVEGIAADRAEEARQIALINAEDAVRQIDREIERALEYLRTEGPASSNADYYIGRANQRVGWLGADLAGAGLNSNNTPLFVLQCHRRLEDYYSAVADAEARIDALGQ